MRKLCALVLVIAMAMAILGVAAPAMAEDEYTDNIIKSDHKVLKKWDFTGEFSMYPGYNWGGLPADTTWTYQIHAKEAVDKLKSAGMVKFVSSTGAEFVGQVDVIDSDGYAYWAARTNEMAFFGTGVYNDITYYFQVLYAEEAIWLCLSPTAYDATLAVEGALSPRAYQVHSLVSGDQFILDPHFVHE